MVRHFGPWSVLAACLSLPVAAAAADPPQGRESAQGDAEPDPAAARAAAAREAQKFLDEQERVSRRTVSLTPEEALDLVANNPYVNLRHLKALDAKTAAVLAASMWHSLDLDGLTAIDADAAAALAKFEGRMLSLSGLKTLDVATAEAVAKFKGKMLFLHGLTRLDTETAAALAKFEGLMQLGGLVRLSDEAADALAKSTAEGLLVPKVIDAVGGGIPLTPATARLVVAHARCLPGIRLPNVKAIGGRDAVEIASILARCAGPVSLPGLERLATDAAAVLMEKRDIDIPPIERLKLIAKPGEGPGRVRELAAELAKLQRLRVPRDIASLTPQLARTVVAERAGRELSLSRLVALDAETAGVLAAFQGRELALPGVTKLDASTAKALAEFRGEWLRLDGLTVLDPATAEALAGFKLRPVPPGAPGPARQAHLCLSGITHLDAATARALALFEGDALHLPGVSAIDPATAEALAAFAGDLSLPGVTAIDAATARALAKFAGRRLSLDGLTALDVATAEALAQFQGQTLSLNGVPMLEAGQAEALAAFQGGTLTMDKMRAAIGDGIPLTPATTRLVCTLAKPRGPLPGLALGTVHLKLDRLVALNRPDAVEVAKILAAYQGRVALPNLRQISPRTLSALLEHPDIEIPLIEKLELIPEPDGGPNDDFVIPADLGERQRRQRGRR